jgi:hypothetical protein
LAFIALFALKYPIMKIDKTIAQALILLSIGFFSLTSCKEKRGCTDSASPNYDPEATLYEFGSCEGSSANIYGTYQGTVEYQAIYCSPYTNTVSLNVYESSTNYITINNIAGSYSLEFYKDGNSISTGYKYISSPSYSEINGGQGTIGNNTLNFSVNIYNNQCESQSYTYSLTK